MKNIIFFLSISICFTQFALAQQKENKKNTINSMMIIKKMNEMLSSPVACKNGFVLSRIDPFNGFLLFFLSFVSSFPEGSSFGDPDYLTSVFSFSSGSSLINPD